MTRSQPMVRHLPSRHTPITPPCRQSTWASSKQLVQPFLTHCRIWWNKTNKDLWLETQVNISWPPMLPSASYHLFLPLFVGSFIDDDHWPFLDWGHTELRPAVREAAVSRRMGTPDPCRPASTGSQTWAGDITTFRRINLGNLSDKRVAVGCLADLGT